MEGLFVAKNENKKLINIKELYNNGDFERALCEVERYLKLYPCDLIALYYKGKILRMLKMFDQAKEVFLNLFPYISENREYKIKVLVELIYLEIYRRDYLTAFSYLERLEKVREFKTIKNMNIDLVKMFLLNQLGICDNNEEKKTNYFEQQVVSYDENKFLNRLLMNNMSEKEKDENFRKFYDDVDLKDLYSEILNVISIAKRTPTYNVFDTYFFYYPKSGFDKYGDLDYVQVLAYRNDKGNICILEISPYRVDKYKNYVNDIVDLEYAKNDLYNQNLLEKKF